MMDESLRKIIFFLQQNINRQFETSDIAFYLKLDETYAAQALNYLQSKKVVTVSTDSSGRAFWQAMDGQKLHETRTENPAISTAVMKNDRKGVQKIKRPSSSRSSFMYGHLLVTIGTVVIVCFFVLSGKIYIDSQIENVNGLVRTSIPVQEYAEFREKFVQDNVIFQKDIAALYSQLEIARSQIDSLKEIVIHLRAEHEGNKKSKY